MTKNSVCKHPDSRSAFSVRGEANIFKGILFASKVIIICYHYLSNTVEHMSCHPEAALEKLGIEEGGHTLKVVDEE